MEVLQMYRFNGSGDDQWEEIHNAHKSSDNNLQVTKKRISWHKYPRFPCSKTIVLLSLCGKAQIAHLGVLNLLKMNGPISLHPMSLLFINTHFHI